MKPQFTKIDQVQLKDLLTQVRAKDGCWEWTGTITGNGYPVHVVPYQNQLGDHIGHLSAGRLCYQFFKGMVPAQKRLLSQCGNKRCIHPEHRRLACEKPEGAGVSRGASRPAAKIDEQKVRRIRELAFEGETQRSIAMLYGISQGLVSKIVKRMLWTHVE